MDDNLMNRDALSRQLQRSGFEVMAVANGMEAISLVEEGGYAMILLDVNMPEMSGMEVLRRVRKSYSSVQLPIIMVTARDQSQEMVEAFNDGANDYVVKPIDFPVLLARITSHLAISAAQSPTSIPELKPFRGNDPHSPPDRSNRPERPDRPR